jgi:hypothetical protein
LAIAWEVLKRQRHRGKTLNRVQLETFTSSFPRELCSPKKKFALEASVGLLSFHNLVENFLPEFATTRLAIITKYLRSEGYVSDNTSINPCLMTTEKARLSLAFYHLELYGLVFTPKYKWQPAGVGPFSTQYLGNMVEGQMEALLCVRAFFLEQVEEYFNQTEEDSLEDYRRLGPHPFQCDERIGNDWPLIHDKSPEYQELWREDYLTHGLFALKTMCDASSAEARLDALGYDAGIDQIRAFREPMCRALAALPSRVLTKASCRVIDNAPNSVTSIEINSTWSEALSWATGYWLSRECNLVAVGLRRWCYIIWDQDRLEKLGVLKYS